MPPGWRSADLCRRGDGRKATPLPLCCGPVMSISALEKAYGVEPAHGHQWWRCRSANSVFEGDRHTGDDKFPSFWFFVSFLGCCCLWLGCLVVCLRLGRKAACKR